jgi:hypothetical protein
LIPEGNSPIAQERSVPSRSQARAAPPGATCDPLRRERNRRLVVHRRGAERQLLQLRLERGDQSRITVANVVDAVAGQIHLLLVGDALQQIPGACL